MRYIILIIAILMLITLSGCEFPDPVGVGVYKGSADSWDYMETKGYGHQGYDTWNPTPDITEHYCSACH